MALESVQAVRQAELDAAAREKDALAKRDALLTEAHQQAKTLVSTRVKEAAAKADDEYKKAELKGAEIMEKAKSKAENQVLFLNELVKSKEQAAIDLVLTNVI